jgi:hypothetical protein
VFDISLFGWAGTEAKSAGYCRLKRGERATCVSREGLLPGGNGPWAAQPYVQRWRREASEAGVAGDGNWGDGRYSPASRA